jgi:hypothetical protein
MLPKLGRSAAVDAVYDRVVYDYLRLELDER